MSTLYRDYRPQNFSEVLGQNHIKITLQNEIVAGRPAHAYIFCGPRAVGKTTLARIMAKALNCEKRPADVAEPCNECASCKSITAGKNLDIIEIDAASNTGVDNVRENIIAFSRLVPTSAKLKVFIIDEVHMLSLSAFNALLKIIEEPPSYVVFILCTTEIQKVPGTVISRCERFDFKRISVSEIVVKLSNIAVAEKISIDASVLEAVARRSGGHLRDAESLLGQIFSLGDKKISAEQAELVLPHYNSYEAINLLDYLGKKDAAKAVSLVNNLIDSGVNFKTFTEEIVGLLRKIMLNKLSPELADNLGLDLGENLEKRLTEVAGHLSWEQIFAFTRRFLESANDNKSPLIPQLPLELAIVELCFGLTPPTPAGLIAPAAPNLHRETIMPNAKPRVNASNIKPETLMPLSSADSSFSSVSLPPHQEIDTGINLNAAAVLAKWPEFLVKIKKYNHSLSFVLQNCEPREIKDGKLTLVFKYKFHHDRVSDPNIKNIVANNLSEVFGCGLGFIALVDEKMELRHEEEAALETPLAAKIKEEPKAAISKPPVADKKVAGGLMADLLKTFGGKVIN
ncbi:MAG: DNA polymerase III subunit gamma/tau [Candidatus Falkowbacteria bacterium]|nr:DNA polymerase III subunit gamma/tau [Candidatus Falkowbacteria bacterium]